MLSAMMTVVLSVSVTCAVPAPVELKGQLKSYDVDRSLMTLLVGEREIARRVSGDVKVFDADGNELKDGLKAERLKPGAMLSVTVETNSDRTQYIKAIRLIKADSSSGEK